MMGGKNIGKAIVKVWLLNKAQNSIAFNQNIKSFTETLETL
jgi:hypothetical protein